MDRRTFIEDAPKYYALAIAVALLSAPPWRETNTLGQLMVFGDVSLHGPLVDAGMRILQEAGVAETLRETFGPPLYRRTPALTEEWLYEQSLHIPIFRRYAEIRNTDWLQEAISDVNDQYSRLSISREDFDEPLPSLWEPLPLDRNDEKLVEATAKVDEAIAEIEADNGYAVNVPGERDYVLQSLKTFSKTLKESAQITGMQIKTFALDPLTAVAKRFAGAALALVAAAAKDAILTWLKASADRFAFFLSRPGRPFHGRLL